MKRSKLVSLVGISLLLVGCGNKTTEPSTEAKKTEAPETGLKTEIVVGASATQKRERNFNPLYQMRSFR